MKFKHPYLQAGHNRAVRKDLDSCYFIPEAGEKGWGHSVLLDWSLGFLP